MMSFQRWRKIDLSSQSVAPTIEQHFIFCSFSRITSVDLTFLQHDEVNHFMVTSCLKGKNRCNWREREYVQPCA